MTAKAWSRHAVHDITNSITRGNTGACSFMHVKIFNSSLSSKVSKFAADILFRAGIKRMGRIALKVICVVTVVSLSTKHNLGALTAKWSDNALYKYPDIYMYVY